MYMYVWVIPTETGKARERKREGEVVNKRYFMMLWSVIKMENRKI